MVETPRETHDSAPGRSHAVPDSRVADSPHDRLRASMTSAMRAFLADGAEAALKDAYELGRDALRDGLGLMELHGAHEAVLVEVLRRPEKSAMVASEIVERAALVYRESAAPFEMAQRGYREANDTLQKLNATLEERARELAAADAIVRSNYELIEQQRDALLRAQQQKEQLTAFVVHDLKNPLSGILLNATVLSRDPNLGADVKSTALRIAGAARSMNQMVMDILDIGRSEEGALVLRRAEVDVSKLLDQAIGSVRARSDAAGQNIECVLHLEQPTISADEDLIRRVLENLLDNAVRHTPRGGRIVVETRSVPTGIETRVGDGGTGIPEADRERVFDKYVQLDPSHSATNRTGRGLGLLFCRLAVEAHGGRIWVEGGAHEGATFAVSLPIG